MDADKIPGLYLDNCHSANGHDGGDKLNGNKLNGDDADEVDDVHDEYNEEMALDEASKKVLEEEAEFYSDSEEDDPDYETTINDEVKQWLALDLDTKVHVEDNNEPSIDVPFPATASQFCPLTGGYTWKMLPSIPFPFYRFTNISGSYVYIGVYTIKSLLLKKNGKLRDVCVMFEDNADVLIEQLESSGIKFKRPFETGLDMTCEWSTFVALISLQLPFPLRISGGGAVYFDD